MQLRRVLIFCYQEQHLSFSSLFSLQLALLLCLPYIITTSTTIMDFCQSEPGFISTALSTYSSNHDATCSKGHDHSPLVMVPGTEEYHEGALCHPTSSPFTSTSDTELAPTPSCDLQQILFYYRSQPDLLQLILESKLQEDRRRSEEARLKAKELDWLLLQQSIHHLIYTQDQQPTLTKRRRDSFLHIDSAEDQVGLFQRMTSR